MSIFRVFKFAAIALAGGAALARNQLDKKIKQSIDKKIAEAQKIALSDLENQVKTIVGDQLISFTRNLFFKACFIAILILFHYMAVYDRISLGYIIAISLALFIVRDVWAIFPAASQLWTLSLRHKWNLFQGLREMVAANVFDKAYEQVMEQTQDAKVKYWIALSRYSHEGISHQIADAISQIAATASVPIVRAHAGLALSKAAIMMLTYSATLAWALLSI